MQSRAGQAIIALLIIGGAGAAVYTILGTGGEEEAPATKKVVASLEAITPPKPLLPNGIEQEPVKEALAILCPPPIDIESLEKQCDELVEKLDPHDRLKAPADLKTRKDRLRESATWSHLVSEYTATSKDPPAIRDEAIELLTRVKNINFDLDEHDKPEMYASLDEVYARLNEIRATGPGNPVLQWLYLSRGGVPVVQEYYNFILNLPNLDCSDNFKLRVSSVFLRTKASNFAVDRQIYETYSQLLATELSGFDPETDDIRSVVETYFSWHLQMSKTTKLWVLMEWAKDKPDIHPFFMNYLAGDACSIVGWASRGSGYADSVDEDGWKVFGEETENSRRYFLKAWSIFPDLPYIPAQLIATARTSAQGSRTAREWFNITTSIRFDYADAYRIYIPSLLPRWGGSDQQMYAFVRECFETNTPLTVVPSQAIRQFRWYLKQEEYLERNFLRYSLEATDMLNYVAEKLVSWKKEHGDHDSLYLKLPREWALSNLIRNRMFLEAAPLITNFEEPIDLDPISKTGDPMFCLQAAKAMGSKNASELDDIEQRFAQPFAEFSMSELEMWNEELKQKAGTTHAPYLRARSEFIRVQAELSAGKEAQLYCDTPAACWANLRCDLPLTNRDTLELTQTDKTRQSGWWNVASRISFPVPYTLKATIERADEANSDVAILLAQRPHDPSLLPAPTKPLKKQAIFELPEGKQLQLEVRVTADTATCFVNGKPVSGDVDEISDELTVWFETRTPLRISNITVASEK